MAKFNAAGAVSVSPAARALHCFFSADSEVHFEDFSHVNFWRLRETDQNFRFAAIS
jgi:hypothetical protein